MVNLSKSLSSIFHNGFFQCPVYFQVLDIIKIGSDLDFCYRLIISDSKYWTSFAIISSELNHVMGFEDLRKFSIIEVEEFEIFAMNHSEYKNNQNVIFIKKFIVIAASSRVDVIGDPKELHINEIPKLYKLQEVPLSKQSVLNSSIEKDDVFSSVNELRCELKNWVIKVRVVGKYPIKNWNNAKGSGKLFSFYVMDNTGLIRIIAFRELAEKFHNFIEDDKVYSISNGQIKVADENFSTLSNDYEMILIKDSKIKQELDDDIPPIPKYDLVSLIDVIEK